MAAPLGLSVPVVTVGIGILGFDFALGFIAVLLGLAFVIALITLPGRYRCECAKVILENFCARCGKTKPGYNTTPEPSNGEAKKLGWRDSLKNNTFPTTIVLAMTPILILSSNSAPLVSKALTAVMGLFLAVWLGRTDTGKIKCGCGRLMSGNSNFCEKCGRGLET